MINIRQRQKLIKAVEAVESWLPPGFIDDVDKVINVDMPRYQAEWEAECKRDPLAIEDPEHCSVIYGMGGWTRYFVGLRSGIVYFSRYHATPDKTNLAERIGFDIR